MRRKINIFRFFDAVHKSVSPFRLSLLPLVLASCLTLLMSSCHYKQNEGAWVYEQNMLPDSATFRENHHYWKGYNFCAADTFSLLSRAPCSPRLTAAPDSTIFVKAEDIIAVEDIQCDTAQGRVVNVWIKVATAGKRNDFQPNAASSPLSGWITETALLEKAVPDTPVSKIIHGLSNPHFRLSVLLAALLCLGLAGGMSWRRRKTGQPLQSVLSNGYPTMLCVWLSACIVLHRSIWHFVPETWTEYYFYPSLNPFTPDLPLIISLFLVSAWGLLLLAVATADELIRSSESLTALIRAACELLLSGIILFGVFAVMTPFALLYPLLAAYWIIAFRCISRRQSRQGPYRCGRCGERMTHLGKCPHCGAINE